jgi:hypothetical protein
MTRALTILLTSAKVPGLAGWNCQPGVAARTLFSEDGPVVGTGGSGGLLITGGCGGIGG